MLVSVKHHTEYQYDHPVLPGTTILKITPRPEPAQRCLRHSLSVTPEPSGISAYIDECGNIAHTMWFSNQTKSLVIDITMEVETLLKDPFNYLVTDSAALNLPMNYAPETSAMLKASIQSTFGSDEDVNRFVNDVLRSSNYDTIRFLSGLCERIASETVHEIREIGDPQTPSETFLRRKGACRDTAVAFIECCRRVGIAARFVSGYKCSSNQPGEDAYMHAWAEIFLPGAGWRGYDPSIGFAVADRHIALASSPFFSTAAPVTGVFMSSVKDVKSKMSASVNITEL
jgi:transglutaminase-like putative cysteine protease